MIVIGAVLIALLLSHPWSPHRLRTPPRRLPEGPAVDLAVVCDLLCAALAAGASLPRACAAVGNVAGGDHGRGLQRSAKALRLGASWEDAWGGHVLGHVLEPAWTDGADPTPLLEQLARSIRAGRKTSARKAAAALTVRLVLPIGLCLLPAFILTGVVPVLVSGSIRILQ